MVAQYNSILSKMIAILLEDVGPGFDLSVYVIESKLVLCTYGLQSIIATWMNKSMKI